MDLFRVFIKDIFSSYQKTIGLFAFALLVIAIPLTLTLVQNEQDIRQFAQTVAPAASCKQPDPIDCKVHLAVPPLNFPEIAAANQRLYRRQIPQGYCATPNYDDRDLVFPGTVNDDDIYNGDTTCVSSFRFRVHYAGSNNFIGKYGQNGGRSKWNYMMAEVKAGMTDFGLAHTYDEDLDFMANYLFGMSFAQLKASEEKNGCSMDSWDKVCRDKDGTGKDKTLDVDCRRQCLNHQQTNLSMDNPPKMVCEDYSPAKSDKSTPALAPPAEIPENSECMVPLAVPPQGVSEISNTRAYCVNRADDIYNGDSKCRVDFIQRVDYIFGAQYNTFKNSFSFFAANVAWNYLMAEVKTGFTDFGDVNTDTRSYQKDLDYASQKFFGKTFSQLRADERANGCRMDSWRFVCRNNSGPKFTSGSDSGKVKDGVRFAGCRLASECLNLGQNGLSNDNPPRMICSNYRPTCECVDLPIVCEIKVNAVSNTSLSSIISIVEGGLCGYDRVNWSLDGELKGTAPIDEEVLFQSMENGSSHSVKGQIFSSSGAREAVDCGVTSIRLPYDNTGGGGGGPIGSSPTPPGGIGTCQVHLAVPPRDISITDRRDHSKPASQWFPEYCGNKGKDVFQFNDGDQICRSGFWERIGYVRNFPEYGDNGKRVKWNYIMSEVRTGYTDFGLGHTYEEDLDRITQQIFGISTFAELSQLEANAGCSMDSFPDVCRTSAGGKHRVFLPDGCQGSVCQGLSTGVAPDKPPKMVCTNYVGGSVITAQNIQPTLTPQAIPTADPNGMAAMVNVQVPALGTDPATGQRLVYNPSQTVTLSISGVGGAKLKDITVVINFNGTIFSGIINLGTDLPSGQPLSFSVKLSNTLSAVIPANPVLTIGETVNLPLVTLTPGDVNNDNALTIQDWNSYVACYGSKTCTEKTASDLNYDGVVNIIDGNLLLRALNQ